MCPKSLYRDHRSHSYLTIAHFRGQMGPGKNEANGQNIQIRIEF